MHHAISAGHQITLNVAREILHEGGNAFDAAVAAHFAMFVTEPCMASAGGGGFALTRTSQGFIQFYDFFCQTPVIKNPGEVDFYPITVDFGTDQEDFHIGMGSVAVPGSVKGIFEIHRRLGSIPIAVLVQPAIELAKKEIEIDAFQAYDIELLEPILKEDPDGRRIFISDGQIKQKGDYIQMHQCADFLEFLSIEEDRGFYQGEISQSIEELSLEKGGHLRRSDLENYDVFVRRPFTIPYHNHSIHLPNGPSKGGAGLALFLAKSDQIHPMLSIKYAREKLQNPHQILPALRDHYVHPEYHLDLGSDGRTGTTHFTIVDREGNTVSLTSTIGEGCGVFIPGTDIQLNNMLGELYLLPGGAHSWIPDTRLHSMMTPTIVTDAQNQLFFAGGSGGAGRIPFAIGQVVRNLMAKKMNLYEAIHQGRFHYQDGVFQVEPHAEKWEQFGDQTKFWNRHSLYFGGVNAVYYNGQDFVAVSDDRRMGTAAVFS